MLKLPDFLNTGIKNISETALRFYLGNSKGRSFILKASGNLRKSAKTRKQYEKKGVHIPPFLICSIADSCNLKCQGCYARANGSCGNNIPKEEMTASDWSKIFDEASELGISFILIAGGEPLLKREVIKIAAQYENIIFPVFTNGTLTDSEYLEFFDNSRNVIPVLSIEGGENQTDARRGEGVFKTIQNVLKFFKEKGILYGISVTVTRENKDTVTENEFVTQMRDQGCGLIFYVEYVPAEKNTEHLILNGSDLQQLKTKISELRKDRKNKGMIVISFPGDEDLMGGCLAAGRGFFHISANGSAEPCPFSPYSEMNLRNNSIFEVLRSDFFEKVRKISMSEIHGLNGGCSLFQAQSDVKNALKLNQE